MRTLQSFVHSRFTVISIVCVLSIVGYQLLAQHVELPFHTSMELFVLPFFALGIAVYRFRQIKWLLVVGLILYACGFWGLWHGHIVLDTLKIQIDTNPIFVYVPAIGGSCLVLGLSLFCEKLMSINIYGRAIRYLSYLGRNSFYIFAVHYPFILFMNSLYWGQLEEPEFCLPYSLLLTVFSIIFSLLIGRLLQRLSPSIFK